jgi:hypothetical protein
MMGCGVAVGRVCGDFGDSFDDFGDNFCSRSALVPVHSVRNNGRHVAGSIGDNYDRSRSMGQTIG